MKKTFFALLASILLVGIAGGEALAVRQGGAFNFCAPYGGDLSGLDPHRTARFQDWLITMQIHRSLYRWDAKESKPILELADKVDISSNGLVYKFTLKNNIKFHNGRSLTVDDIIWSYERIMNTKTASPSVSLIRVIKGAKEMENGKADKMSGLRKIDDYTLEVTLKSPIDIAYTLWRPGTAILPREEVEKKGYGFATEPVGCGPFQFVKWVKGSEVQLKKFPDFYEQGKPYLDKVVYKIMGEGSARDLAFRAKELDASIVGADQYPVYKKDPQISKNMVEVAEMFTRHMGFNPAYEPFSNKLVRQAINYAIDSRLIIKKLLKGKAFPCVSWLPSTSQAFDPKAKGYEYDPEKAKKLMKEAGYEKGFTFECLGQSNRSWGVIVIEALIPYLKKINITVKPILLEGSTFAERLNKCDFQAYMWSRASGPDPLQALQRFHSKNPCSAGNYVLHNNPKFDKLLDTAAQERNEAKRMEFLRKANAMFGEDAPMWFFNYNKAIIVYQPWVHGIKAVATEMMFQDLVDIWIDKSSPRAKKK